MKLPQSCSEGWSTVSLIAAPYACFIGWEENRAILCYPIRSIHRLSAGFRPPLPFLTQLGLFVPPPPLFSFRHWQVSFISQLCGSYKKKEISHQASFCLELGFKKDFKYVFGLFSPFVFTSFTASETLSDPPLSLECLTQTTCQLASHLSWHLVLVPGWSSVYHLNGDHSGRGGELGAWPTPFDRRLSRYMSPGTSPVTERRMRPGAEADTTVSSGPAPPPLPCGADV